jgi:hypothetical protein
VLNLSKRRIYDRFPRELGLTKTTGVGHFHEVKRARLYQSTRRTGSHRAPAALARYIEGEDIFIGGLHDTVYSDLRQKGR